MRGSNPHCPIASHEVNINPRDHWTVSAGTFSRGHKMSKSGDELCKIINDAIAESVGFCAEDEGKNPEFSGVVQHAYIREGLIILEVER
jgi:hypothetical protein